jgi:glycosyltransferase involved in cell wall biosynthesis
MALYLDRNMFELDYVILNDTDPIISFLQENNIPYRTTRFTDYANTPEVVKFLYDHLKANKTDVVMTDFFASDFTGIQAAFYAGVPVRVYTRHHSGIKWKRHARSKFEMLWDMATDIVGLTEQGRQIMISDGIRPEKITVIPYGYDITQFNAISEERCEILRQKYGIQDRYPVIGVLARYIATKGIRYTLEAYKEVLKVYPKALLVLAGSHVQPLKEQAAGAPLLPRTDEAIAIQEQIKELPADSYVEIYFEEDLFALYKLFDVVVQVPIAPDAEAFSMVYMESMLSRVPSVVTLASPAHDYAVHKHHAWVVDFENSEQIYEGIIALCQQPELRQSIIDNGYEFAKHYTFERRVRAYEELFIRRFLASQTKMYHQP